MIVKRKKKDENEQIKSLITNSKNKSPETQNSSNQNTNFEISILEKIKNNNPKDMNISDT